MARKPKPRRTGPTEALAAATRRAFALTAILLLSAAASAAAQSRIVYYSGSNPSGLWTMSLNGSSPKPFLSASTGQANGANFSANGAKFVYQVGGSVPCNVNFGPGQIIAANADGSRPVTIGSGCSPRISPDGTRVLYLGPAVNGGTNPVFVASLSNPTHSQSIISPNCLAYVAANYASYPNFQSVCVLNQLAAWVGNSTVVLSGYQNGLWEQSAAGGLPHPILSGGDRNSDWYGGLSVSPDGSTIAGYPLSQTASAFQLVTVPSGGGSLHPLYTQASNSSNTYDYPQWLDNHTLVVRHISGSGGQTTDRIAVTPSASFAPHDLNPADTNAGFPALAFKPSDHVLTLSFSPGSVDANGLGHFTGSAKDVDKTGAPVASASISFNAPLSVFPRALVCSPTGLVYPRLLSDGSPLGSGFGLNTDSGGLVPLSVWVGTTPGSWLLQASETVDSSVSAALSFPFADQGGSAFAPAQTPDDLYHAVRATIAGGGINLFKNFAGIGQSEASSQAVLTAFLELNLRHFPGADFGPVHAGAHAGVVFYRHGTTDPSAGVVIGIAQAASIITAAGSGQPIPSADQSVPSLAAWAAQNGAASGPATLGSLSPPPQEELLYFGFPYPPPASSAAAQVSFYGPCLQPDPALQMVQTHSPVVLTFTGAHGYRFGMSAKGRRVGSGTGFVVRKGDQTTYVIPAGRYKVSVLATGSGGATIVTLSPGHHATSASTFSLRVRRGQHGGFALGGHGPTGSLRIAGHRVRSIAGLPLSLRGIPARVRHAHHNRLSLKLSSLGSPVVGALVTVAGHAHAAAVSNSRGVAVLTIRPSKGKLTLTITAPGFRTIRRTLTAH